MTTSLSNLLKQFKVVEFIFHDYQTKITVNLAKYSFKFPQLFKRWLELNLFQLVKIVVVLFCFVKSAMEYSAIFCYFFSTMSNLTKKLNNFSFFLLSLVSKLCTMCKFLHKTFNENFTTSEKNALLSDEWGIFPAPNSQNDRIHIPIWKW